MRRISIRMLISLCASFTVSIATSDVKKAFVMSRTRLCRKVYLRAPPEFQLPKGQLLRLVKPLYGITDTPMHCLKTCADYHRNEVKILPGASDPCCWYQNHNGELQGSLALQGDHILFAGTKEFLVDESRKWDVFLNSGRTVITSTRTRFNGIGIHLDE